ncbi:MAG: 2-succinyl-5-enolpyruvyl-6-hydroxy-3-cyclohexene-1-carboxylic-acid synthase, partial [Candidatus Nanopelagicales bacterium]
MSTSSPQRGVRLVEALLAAGVRHVVAAPGSRSAPLLLAAADAERQGLLRLHVRVDERSAGYLALGLARVSGTPVAVITTSGTAAVNLHPAIVEAAYLGVPLIAVTADRPAELRGSGANQTIDQRALFGIDAPTIDLDGTSENEFELVIDAVTSTVTQHGPVHLNVSLTEPLVAEGEHVVRPATTRAAPSMSAPSRRPLVELARGADLRRGLLIAGDGLDDVLRAQARELAETMGWPIISEPSGNLTGTPQSVGHGPLLLGDPTVLAELQPDVVVSVGRIGLHRSIMRLVREVPVHIAVDVAPRRGRVDPARTANVIVDAVPTGVTDASDPQWMSNWRRLDRARSDRVAAVLSQAPLTGPVVARI